MVTQEWRARSIASESEIVDALVLDNVTVHPVIAQALWSRGIRTAEAFSNFLNPCENDIYIYEEIPQIQVAAAFLIEAIEAKRKLVVYGDYDADGVTGTALLLSALRKLGVDASYYLPHRYTEGYGLNKLAIQSLADEGARVLLTVDCGISNYEEIELARSLGMDVIITDHHTLPERLPCANFIVSSKFLASESPLYTLSGVGVAYKLIVAIYKKLGKLSLLYNGFLLDFVCIGTVADIVPLLDNNRVLVKFGLDYLNKNASDVIRFLIPQHKSSAGTSAATKIDTSTISFHIAPKLNAAGRMDHANIALDLLMSCNRDRSHDLAEEINALNERRKEAGARIKQEALELLEQHPEMTDDLVVFIQGMDWNPGIIGIVAAQLTKIINKPVIIIAARDGFARGSIRTVNGIDIFSALEKCSQLLINYGGHKEAAGFELHIDQLDAFKARYLLSLEAGVQQQLGCVLHYDVEIQAEDISMELVTALELVKPYGKNNPEMVFLTRNMSPMDYRLVGPDQNHVKLTFVDGFRQIDAIGFGLADSVSLLNNNIDVLYQLEKNIFGNRTTLQMRLLDVKASINGS